MVLCAISPCATDVPAGNVLLGFPVVGEQAMEVGLARDSGGLTMAGGLTLGAGTVALVLGILAIRADAPTYRPGSSNHFPLAAASP